MNNRRWSMHNAHHGQSREGQLSALTPNALNLALTGPSP
jgi:hypothetical protein